MPKHFGRSVILAFVYGGALLTDGMFAIGVGRSNFWGGMVFVVCGIGLIIGLAGEFTKMSARREAQPSDPRVIQIPESIRE